jgi:hypothetical protein
MTDTDEMSHESSGWLKDDALKNIQYMFDKDEALRVTHSF